MRLAEQVVAEFVVLAMGRLRRLSAGMGTQPIREHVGRVAREVRDPAGWGLLAPSPMAGREGQQGGGDLGQHHHLVSADDDPELGPDNRVGMHHVSHVGLPHLLHHWYGASETTWFGWVAHISSSRNV